MKPIKAEYQSGFALLIFVVVLMGIGGFVLVGYGQSLLKEAEVKKFDHNTRVLKEAKQALLQFAYNYPVTNGNGPGRLPCADTDNDGTPNVAFGPCTTLGRLPWNQQNLNLYDIRDASGQRLWYAVSNNFATQTASGLNSDEFGTITLRDQSGSIIYNGAHPGDPAKYGVAAIIIAPGEITARNGVTQNRSIANADSPFDTTADTDPGIILASNYLDLAFGTEDNANFTQDSATDGFILGPVNNQSSDAVNDQFIVITAAEVIEVAEKAVLQAYQTALRAYDQRIDSDVATGAHYPWLYNYDVYYYGAAPLPTDRELDEYPANSNFATEKANSLGSSGRIPSIFTPYFTETDSQPIESHLGISLVLDYPISPFTVGFDQAFDKCPSNPAIDCSSGALDFDGGPTGVPPIIHAISLISSDPLTAVTFANIEPDVFSANDGRLTAAVTTAETFSVVKYFWDEEPSGNGWVECQGGADQIADCNRDSSGNPDPGGSNNTPSQILRVRLDVDLNGVIDFGMNYVTPPAVTVNNAADINQHSNITATFTGANLDDTTLPITLSYIYDSNYDSTFDNQANGTLSLADLLQPAGSSLALTLRYYPELPDWAFGDGWHDSVQMAYANNLRPDIALNCIEGVLPPNNCLTIKNMSGNTDNKISILIIAGQHDWNDGAVDGLANDVGDVFDFENDDLDDVFDVRAVSGNDRILVMDEL